MEELEAVEHPLVPFVRNPRFGLVLRADAVVCRERRVVVRRRGWIEDHVNTRPVLTCAECGTPVHLRSSKKGRWYFRHQDGSGEDCIYRKKADRNLDELDAYRYNGQKEGPRHREMKRLVKASLEADARFSKPEEETRWKGIYNPKTWRKPDLQSHYNGLRIAFEMQPSATYINVIRGRRQFFLDEGGLLFWIFPSLDPDLLRLYHEDVFYNNNSNLFVVDAETLDQSARTGKFTLRCHYCIPRTAGTDVIDEWQEKFVTIDDLTIERRKQEVYYFDYRSERIKVQQAKETARDDAIRAALERFWERHGAGYTNEGQAEYVPTRDALRILGLPAPASYYEQPFFALMALLFSAKHGRPIGFNHAKLISVAHTAFDHHKTLLLPFGWVAKLHGTDAILREQDTSEKWQARGKAIRAKIAQRDPAFMPDTQYAALVDFLFPGVGEQLRRNRKRWGSGDDQNLMTNQHGRSSVPGRHDRQTRP